MAPNTTVSALDSSHRREKPWPLRQRRTASSTMKAMEPAIADLTSTTITKVQNTSRPPNGATM